MRLSRLTPPHARAALIEIRCKEASWKEAQLDAQVKTYVCNETNERLIDDYGYIAEIAIPRSKLTITSGQVLVNFSITKRNSLDAICDVASTSTARWIPVTGL